MSQGRVRKTKKASPRSQAKVLIQWLQTNEKTKNNYKNAMQ
jgi:hypothetical protein